MNKVEYLECLKSNLRNIPEQETANIVYYYMEYFEDAGIVNEQIVISELGKPELLASKVSADYVIKDIQKKEEKVKNINQVKQGFSNIWVMILAICGFPIWFPIVIALAAILFTFVIAVFVIIFSFNVAAITIIGSGLFAIAVGVIVLFNHIPTGLSTVGTGCIAIGIGFLFLYATVQIGNLFKIIILKITKIRIRGGIRNNEKDI